MSSFQVMSLTETLLQEMKEMHKSSGEILLLSSQTQFVEMVLRTLPVEGKNLSREEWIAILKCLRHACAGSFSNALLLVKESTLIAVLEVISLSYSSYLAEKESMYEASSSESLLDAPYATLFNVAVQVLSNFSSCKEPTSDEPPTAAILWSLAGVDGFCQLFNIAVTFCSRSGLSATFAALYNCLLVPDLEVGMIIASSRQLSCQMALSVIDLQFAEISKSSTSHSTTVTPSKSEPNVEWFQIVVLNLLKTGDIIGVLNTVKRSQDVLLNTENYTECFSVTMTHEEIIYLCVLDTVLSDNSALEDLLGNENSFQTLLQLLSTFSSLLLPTTPPTSSLFPDVVEINATSVSIDEQYAKYLTVSKPPSCDVEKSSNSHLDIASLSTPAASVCLNILTTLASISNSQFGKAKSSSSVYVGEAVKQKMLETGIMNICCSFLTGLNKIKTDKTSGANGKRIPVSDEEKTLAEYSSELAKLCLQVVMNMTYRCKKAQDYCREIGGFTSILSYCSTDFDSPLSREWALMCVRNMCEDNIENQQFVSSLQVKGVLKDELLEAQGIEVEMDPARGKFSFSQKKKEN